MYYLLIYFLADAMGSCSHHKCLGLTVSVYSHEKKKNLTGKLVGRSIFVFPPEELRESRRSRQVVLKACCNISRSMNFWGGILQLHLKCSEMVIWWHTVGALLPHSKRVQARVGSFCVDVLIMLVLLSFKKSNIFYQKKIWKLIFSTLFWQRGRLTTGVGP